MARTLQFTRLMTSSARTSLTSLLVCSFKPRNVFKPCFSSLFFSTSTPYPLQYEMIINRPTQSSLSQARCRPVRISRPDSPDQLEPEEQDFDSWVDKKLALERESGRPGSGGLEMDKAKRKYYSKRRKRLYGSDSDDENRKPGDGFVELKPEVVEFDRLHQREEELYFYDAFAYPWEKDRHYKMVYQLEKKYFPDQCFDKAFLQPGESNFENGKVRRKNKTGRKKNDVTVKNGDNDDKKLVFFDEKEKKKEDVTEKKVEEFFKCLKKFPNEKAMVGDGEPFLVTRNGELPSRWDGPNGIVVLVNKPKGEGRLMCLDVFGVFSGIGHHVLNW